MNTKNLYSFFELNYAQAVRNKPWFPENLPRSSKEFQFIFSGDERYDGQDRDWQNLQLLNRVKYPNEHQLDKIFIKRFGFALLKCAVRIFAHVEI